MFGRDSAARAPSDKTHRSGTVHRIHFFSLLILSLTPRELVEPIFLAPLARATVPLSAVQKLKRTGTLPNTAIRSGSMLCLFWQAIQLQVVREVGRIFGNHCFCATRVKIARTDSPSKPGQNTLRTLGHTRPSVALTGNADTEPKRHS